MKFILLLGQCRSGKYHSASPGDELRVSLQFQVGLETERSGIMKTAITHGQAVIRRGSLAKVALLAAMTFPETATACRLVVSGLELL